MPPTSTEDLSSPIILKYQTAGTIVNDVLQSVLAECKPGAQISKLCELGDSLIVSKCEKVYTKKEKGEKLRKGIAFPTCITINEMCAHFSPFESDSIELKTDDLVKVELGCHIDGYIARAGHTIVLTDSKIDSRKSKVIRAAWTIGEVIMHTLGPNTTNANITRLMNKTAEQFGCKMVMDVESHQIKQHIIDGVRSIKSRKSVDEKVDTFSFENHEVYAINILVSTAEGKPKESERRTCVYKRNMHQTYSLKTPLSRKFLSEVTSNFFVLPFTIRMMSDQTSTRIGIVECTRHNLLQPYPILCEKPGEYIAQFTFTVMILPNKLSKFAGLPFTQADLIDTSIEIQDPEILTILATPTKFKKKKKQNNEKQSDAKQFDETKEPNVAGTSEDKDIKSPAT